MQCEPSPGMPSGTPRTGGSSEFVRWAVIFWSLFCWAFPLHAQNPRGCNTETKDIDEVSVDPPPGERPAVPPVDGVPQTGNSFPESAMEEEAQIAPVSSQVIEEIRSHIDALNEVLKESGSPCYSPKYIYVVDPKTQRMHILFAKSYGLACTLPAGTGSRGVGFGSSQTPPGFYTMGGVRIAKDASSDIQTGSNLAGISGVFAELHYPPDHPKVAERGKIPINVVMHSYNPKASNMLRNRFEKGLIGKVPCTMGCPVFNPQDAPVVAPYFEQSAGEFDPASKPGPALRELLRTGKVVEYTHKRIGDVIFVINPSASAPEPATIK